MVTSSDVYHMLQMSTKHQSRNGCCAIRWQSALLALCQFCRIVWSLYNYRLHTISCQHSLPAAKFKADAGVVPAQSAGRAAYEHGVSFIACMLVKCHSTKCDCALHGGLQAGSSHSFIFSWRMDPGGSLALQPHVFNGLNASMPSLA